MITLPTSQCTKNNISQVYHIAFTNRLQTIDGFQFSPAQTSVINNASSTGTLFASGLRAFGCETIGNCRLLRVINLNKIFVDLSCL